MNTRETELFHYGIEGMKWGVRRYQNADGSYTAAGRQRYGVKGVKKAAKIESKKEKAVAGIQKDIDKATANKNSYSGYEKTGISTKSGKQVLSSSDVQKQIGKYDEQIKGLSQAQEKIAEKYDNQLEKLASDNATKVGNKVAKLEAQKSSALSGVQNDIDKLQANIDSYSGYEKTGISSNSGKLVMSSEDVQKEISKYQSQIDGLQQAAAKLESDYNQKIKDAKG